MFRVASHIPYSVTCSLSILIKINRQCQGSYLRLKKKNPRFRVAISPVLSLSVADGVFFVVAENHVVNIYSCEVIHPITSFLFNFNVLIIAPKMEKASSFHRVLQTIYKIAAAGRFRPAAFFISRPHFPRPELPSAPSPARRGSGRRRCAAFLCPRSTAPWCPRPRTFPAADRSSLSAFCRCC